MSYESNLLEAKAKYPFESWREAGVNGLEQYTEENCNKAKAILDQLISELIGLGEDAPEENKIGKFKVAVESLNELNDETGGALIETDEREELCPLIDAIAEKVGIDPKKYEGGDLAYQWRDW